MFKINHNGFIQIPVVILILIIVGSSIYILKTLSSIKQSVNTKTPGIATNSAHLKTPTPVSSAALKTTNKASTNPTASPKPSNSTASQNNTSNPSPSSSSTTTSSTGTLNGTVKNSSGNILSYASIQLSCSSCGKLRNGDFQDEQADGSGNFTVNNLPAITLSVKAFSGHWGDSQTVTITGGQTSNINLVVGADTTAKPTISITKGPYSNGPAAPCFDVAATHPNSYQLNAEYYFDSDLPFKGANLNSSGANTYSGTICGDKLGGPHIFYVRSYTVSTHTYSDTLTQSYTYP